MAEQGELLSDLTESDSSDGLIESLCASSLDSDDWEDEKAQDLLEFQGDILTKKIIEQTEVLRYNCGEENTKQLTRFFEAGLIWDTLTESSNETAIFDQKGHPASYRAELRYKFREGKDGVARIEVVKRKATEQPGFTIIVEYCSKTYGKERFQKHFSSLTLATHSINTPVWDGDPSLQGLKQFPEPRVQCAPEFRDKMEIIIRHKRGMIAMTEAKKKTRDEMKRCHDLFAQVIEARRWRVRFRNDKDFLAVVEKKIIRETRRMEQASTKIASIADFSNWKEPKDVLKKAARLYSYFHNLTEGCNDLQQKWEKFLDMACQIYDQLWTCDFPTIKVKLKKHDGNCEFCKKIHDKPFEKPNYLGDELTEREFCSIPNVIYLITCTAPKCDKRYVGKTNRTLKERYPGGTKCDENDHFCDPEHTEKFQILQIIDESSFLECVFPGRSIQKFIKTSKVELKGIEKIWIDRKDDENLLNKVKNFSYADKHRQRVKSILCHLAFGKEGIPVPTGDSCYAFMSQFLDG